MNKLNAVYIWLYGPEKKEIINWFLELYKKEEDLIYFQETEDRWDGYSDQKTVVDDDLTCNSLKEVIFNEYSGIGSNQFLKNGCYIDLYYKHYIVVNDTKINMLFKNNRFLSAAANLFVEIRIDEIKNLNFNEFISFIEQKYNIKK
jgi:hypothetical protein